MAIRFLVAYPTDRRWIQGKFYIVKWHASTSSKADKHLQKFDEATLCQQELG